MGWWSRREAAAPARGPSSPRRSPRPFRGGPVPPWPSAGLPDCVGPTRRGRSAELGRVRLLQVLILVEVANNLRETHPDPFGISTSSVCYSTTVHRLSTVSFSPFPCGLVPYILPIAAREAFWCMIKLCILASLICSQATRLGGTMDPLEF